MPLTSSDSHPLASSPDSLVGKVALVTGAGRNIGRAIALALAKEGAAVVVNARADQQELKLLTGEIGAMGQRAAGIVGDIGSRIEVDRISHEAVQPFGEIDILVNNAAIRPAQPFLEITDDDWGRVLDVNLSAPYRFAQALLPNMVKKGWGRIINFSGRDSFERPRGRAHVTVTKNGIVGLTRVLAMEFASYGVTTNTIVPGS
ncbi:SDR family NAD(P)-dependent oxidoreductase, partial [Dehalococcoidia bacterium]|nr:SDR family NAD(P)-dependent oxidoreductase [Dehalococcoidia bacterium]